VPEHYTDEHLQILSMLAEMFSDASLLEKLRSAGSSEQIYRLLGDWRPSGGASG
jgi:PTS system nitrogen regulatory IIA component